MHYQSSEKSACWADDKKVLLLRLQSLPSIPLLNNMPGKEHRWLPKAFRPRLSKRNKAAQKGDSNQRDDQFTPPAHPTPSSDIAGSTTDAGISQIANTEPVPLPVGVQSNLPASSVQELTMPTAEYAPATVTNLLLGSRLLFGKKPPSRQHQSNSGTKPMMASNYMNPSCSSSTRQSCRAKSTAPKV